MCSPRFLLRDVTPRYQELVRLKNMIGYSFTPYRFDDRTFRVKIKVKTVAEK